MFKRKIIQKRVIALILAVVLLAAIPLLTASAVGGEKGKPHCVNGCGDNVTILPTQQVGLRCMMLLAQCNVCSAHMSFYSHEGRPNEYGFCTTCWQPW